MLSRFEVYAIPIDGESAKERQILRFFPPIFYGWGKKNFAGRFSGLTPHQICVQISRRSVKGRLRSIV